MLFSGHHPRKSFGQHWLIDESILEKIILAANIKASDRILEIGPGKGALTERLLDSKAAYIHAIEIDRDLAYGLRRKFSNHPKFSLTEGDVLSMPLSFKDGLPGNKVVANIPYNITGPLLEKLLGSLTQEASYRFKSLVLLMQKEVADRILALPGNSAFSALTVRLQLLGKCNSVCDVSPVCFYPVPKVDSKVIEIKPYTDNERLSTNIEKNLDILIKVAFSQRRKKLKNTLKDICSLDVLENIADEIGITLNERPQELSILKWVQLSKGIKFNRSSITI